MRPYVIGSYAGHAHSAPSRQAHAIIRLPCQKNKLKEFAAHLIGRDQRAARNWGANRCILADSQRAGITGYYSNVSNMTVSQVLLEIFFCAHLGPCMHGRGTGDFMWWFMWREPSRRTQKLCNRLKRLVAGEGFEPSTFGL